MTTNFLPIIEIKYNKYLYDQLYRKLCSKAFYTAFMR